MIKENFIQRGEKEREDRGRVLEKKFAPETKNIPTTELQKATHPFIFSKMVGLIKKYQPEGWNPSDPSPDFMLGRDFHYFLFEEMRKNNWVDDDIDNVKLYTALGSYVDLHNNTDLIVEYSDKELEDNIYFTIDIKAGSDEYFGGLTARDEKLKNIMHNEADFILNIDTSLINETSDKEEDKMKRGKLRIVLEKKAKEMVHKLEEKRRYLIKTRKF